jgi:sugar phosphate isomerase/epimerase
MKIAYGTYGLPHLPFEDAIALCSSVGYDGLEVYSGPKHLGSLPEQLDPSRRQRVRDLLAEKGLQIPALVTFGNVLAPDAETHQDNLARVRAVAQLGRDLGVAGSPVVSMGLGGQSDQWETQRDMLLRYLKDYARVASGEGLILAGEVHSWAAAGRVERALWLFQSVDSPYVRLHFDIGQFLLAGETIEDAVKKLTPVTAHTHVCDYRRYPDGRFDLLPLGQGDLDIPAYVRAMHAAGWRGHLTVEVSARVWSKPDYDFLNLARSAYQAMVTALGQAGAPRG